jgi:hypothetical protein
MRRPGDDALRCEPDPCWYGNGGCDVLTSCIATDAGPVCTECPAGYLGNGETGCVPVTDHCAGVTCGGVGACLRGADDYACACPPGRSGKDCELSFASISARYGDLCGVRTDGTLSCWSDFNPLSPPAGTFTSVTAGLDYACALDSSGHAQCFGESGSIPPPTDVLTQIVGLGRAPCGLRLDGSVVCWGDGTNTALPGTFKALAFSNIQRCGIELDGTIACFSWGSDEPSSYPPPAGVFSSISAWNGETCAIRDDGAVLCWVFSKGSPEGDFSAIALGDAQNCGILTDGTLRCWNASATTVPAPGTFTAIATGQDRTCAVRSDGILICWGLGSANGFPANGSFQGIEAPCNELACTNGRCAYDWVTVSCQCDSGYRPTESRLACESAG